MLSNLITAAWTLALGQAMTLEDHPNTLTQAEMLESNVTPEGLTLA